MSEAYAAQPPGPANDQQPPQQAQHPLLRLIGVQNLADHLDAHVLTTMGGKVCEEFALDEASRDTEGWTERNDAAMKLALQVREDKNYPWPKASNVKFPLLSTAAIQFNARSYSALIDGSNVVKGKVLGPDDGVAAVDPQTGQPAQGPDGQPQWQVQPGAKQARADRVAAHMSYQLLFEMDGWEEDTDKLLMMLPIVGCAFRKSYFDPVRGYNCSHVVPPKEFVVNYWTRDLDSCPRATHVLKFYPHEIAEKMRSGIWLEAELGPATDASNDAQAPHEFLEQHRLWDLDGDDYPEPYIITVHKETQKVVRVVARFDEDGLTLKGDKVISIKPTQVFTKYPFIPAPDGSFYDIGFGTLLLPLNGAIDSTINQLMDAGHLANVQGGFIGAGVSIKSGNLSFRPGEWKKVESAGGPLRDSLVPLPVTPPSTVLFQLLGMLIEASKDVTATQDILSGDTGQSQQPVGTTLAVIEQGLKTFTAIVKRLHRALKHELGILFALNRRYLQPKQYFAFQDTPGVIERADYDAKDLDIVPVSDPSMATDMQKLGRAQFLMQFLGKGLNDMAIIERVLEAASIADIKALMPQGPPPVDPKIQIEERRVQQKDRELDQRDIELTLQHALTKSNVDLNEANAQNAMANAILAMPNFQLQIAQMIDEREQAKLDGQNASTSTGEMNGPSPQAPQPGPTGIPALPPGHALVSAVPPGPAGPPDGAMGAGPGNGPPPPDQGAPFGGTGGPGV